MPIQLKRLITKDKSFYKNLASLSLPIGIQNLISFLMILTSNVTVGRVGESATASAYVGTLTFTVLQMLSTGVDGGISIACSRYWGEGDKSKINKVLACGIYLSLGLSIPITVTALVYPEAFVSLFLSSDGAAESAGYLRAIGPSFIPFVLSGAIGSSLRSTGSPKIVTLSSATAFFVNLIFSYTLTFGKLGFAKQGIYGAATAIVAARIAELAVLIFYKFSIDKKLGCNARGTYHADKKSFIEFMRYTSPVVLGQAVWIINTLFSSYLISNVGNDSAVAALSVTSTLNSLSYVFTNGLAGAVGIIIGKTIGEGRCKKIKEYSYTTQIIFIAIGIITSVSLLIVKHPFISLYNVGDESSKIAAQFISVLAVTVIGTSYQSACLTGLVKSGGDVSFVLKNDAFFVFFAVIPLSVAAAKLSFPIWLVFLALKSDQILKCIPAAIKINRFRWIKKL